MRRFPYILSATIVILHMLTGTTVASPPKRLPAPGVTIKVDAVNEIVAPGLKVWLLRSVLMEGFYAGFSREYDGYAVRAMVLLPWAWDQAPERAVQPYAGVGYISIQQDIAPSRFQVAISDAAGHSWGGSADVRIRASGAGPQFFAGLQVTPLKKHRHLLFEIELAHAMLDVEGHGKIRTQGTGPLADLSTVTHVQVKSDYHQTSLMAALTYYF